ncbi:MAG: RNase adapter RapZ [Peptostreptococcaceae bacterium]|nr:RNase adapter RapZ [Peptostreptococcaceae bacterium]
MEVVIVTGLSGAGKSQGVICLEDLGYYCIDNMPPALIKDFLKLAINENSPVEKVAFVVDIRGGDFFADLKMCLEEIKQGGVDLKIIFLEATDEVLMRRFKETRRLHPLSRAGSVREGLKKERNLLEEIRDIADYVIDTSNMKPLKLREEIKKIFSEEGDISTFTINIQSFGFKNGIPLEADMVFDMRFIPNPFYVASLKGLTGNNKKVRDYVMKQPESKQFFETIHKLINSIIPAYIRESKYSLNISFGCTGGQHRSVTIANEFAQIFKKEGRRITLEHRDL